MIMTRVLLKLVLAVVYAVATARPDPRAPMLLAIVHLTLAYLEVSSTCYS